MYSLLKKAASIFTLKNFVIFLAATSTASASKDQQSTNKAVKIYPSIDQSLNPYLYPLNPFMNNGICSSEHDIELAASLSPFPEENHFLDAEEIDELKQILLKKIIFSDKMKKHCNAYAISRKEMKTKILNIFLELAKNKTFYCTLQSVLANSNFQIELALLGEGANSSQNIGGQYIFGQRSASEKYVQTLMLYSVSARAQRDKEGFMIAINHELDHAHKDNQNSNKLAKNGLPNNSLNFYGAFTLTACSVDVNNKMINFNCAELDNIFTLFRARVEKFEKLFVDLENNKELNEHDRKSLKELTNAGKDYHSRVYPIQYGKETLDNLKKTNRINNALELIDSPIYQPAPLYTKLKRTLVISSLKTNEIGAETFAHIKHNGNMAKACVQDLRSTIDLVDTYYPNKNSDESRSEFAAHMNELLSLYPRLQKYSYQRLRNTI